MSKEGGLEFILLPLNLPADAPQILRLHYQAYTSNPKPTESEFITANLQPTLSRFSNPGNLMAKLVLSSDHSKIVSYIVLSPPKPPDSRSEEEKAAALRKEIESISVIQDKELTFRLKTEDRLLNEKFFGPNYESRFWELTSLVTDPEYQRRGLGSRLVKFGLEHVEAMVRRSEGRLEGVYLIANPAGRKTYLKAGFEKVGERERGRSWRRG